MRLTFISSLFAICALVLNSPPALAGDKGGEAFNAGDYATTVSEWTSKVRNGDARAPYNLGVLYENGLANLPRDLNQAMSLYLLGAQRGDLPSMVAIGRTQIAAGQTAAGLSWLNLAARWNDQDAIGMLQRLGQPVPGPDLFTAKQQADDQAATVLGYSLGCMLAGGCSNGFVARPVRPPASSYQAPRPAQPNAGVAPMPLLCPDGRYVRGLCIGAPDGSYVGGAPQVAPDGTYLTGRPRIAPNGKYVGGEGPMTVCPDGNYVVGKTCRLMPNGQYLGQ